MAHSTRRHVTSHRLADYPYEGGGTTNSAGAAATSSPFGPGIGGGNPAGAGATSNVFGPGISGGYPGDGGGTSNPFDPGIGCGNPGDQGTGCGYPGDQGTGGGYPGDQGTGGGYPGDQGTGGGNPQDPGTTTTTTPTTPTTTGTTTTTTTPTTTGTTTTTTTTPGAGSGRPGNSRGTGVGQGPPGPVITTPIATPTPTPPPAPTPTPTPITPAPKPGSTPRGATFTSTPSVLTHNPLAATSPSGLSSALGSSPGRSGTTGRTTRLFTSPLARGLGGVTPRRPAAARAASTPRSGRRTSVTTSNGLSAGHSANPQPSSPNVIQRFVNVIPGLVWLLLGASLALATLGGAAVFWSGRRVRRQAGRFAAASAAALTDPLTGVLNRRGFLDSVERELARAKRYGRPFVLAYVDVRGLKAVNDTEGHLAGDKLLREAASLLRESARADDVVGRIGGDEMGLLLAEQSTEGAAAVMNRISSQVPERRRSLGLRSEWDLTIGTATYPKDGTTVTELLATADRRLYQQRGIALT